MTKPLPADKLAIFNGRQIKLMAKAIAGIEKENARMECSAAFEKMLKEANPRFSVARWDNMIDGGKEPTDGSPFALYDADLEEWVVFARLDKGKRAYGIASQHENKAEAEAAAFLLS